MPRFVVHRGGAALWPENSLLAFGNAIALGARLLEFDVHGTADGEAVVIHDPTLERTTDASGPVAARTAAELRGVRLKGLDGTLTDQWVPTIGEVLALTAPADLTLLIEIKTPGTAVRYERQGHRVRAVPGPRYEGLERKVVEAVGTAGVADHAYIMAFNPAVLAEIRALAPRQSTALLVDRQHLEGAGAPAVEAVAWAAAARANFLGLHYTLCDEGVVEAARRAGIALGVFTVNDEAAMRRLADLGADVIITDRADLAVRMAAVAP
ncbi:MAG TPA: glycerophosphodiester phosphodiesterase family protein [Methylomirabilota bacterium]|jgi:glycerophosphoryl diester phosphodiesterase|nr:glycerophosphodiester phosphodiesterase family protein [Methylomirabilota bacterium]